LKINWRYGKNYLQGSVDHYLCMDTRFCQTAKIDGARCAHQWLLQAARKMNVPERGGMFVFNDPDGVPIQVNKDSVDRCYKGKGTPYEILMTLFLATHVGQITADKSKVNPRCATPEYYSHAYLGMDCNGFAMNYLGMDAETPIDDLDKNSKPFRRKELTDIRPGDAMIEGSNYKHIAIVSKVEPGAAGYKNCLTIHTWEAYGWCLQGVSHHFRYIERKAPGVFHEQKPGKPNESDFYFQPVAQRKSPNR